MSDKSQRTEKPTQRRIDKARKDGQFAVSKEFVSGWQFVAVLAVLIASAPAMLDGLIAFMRRSIQDAFSGELGIGELHQLLLAHGARFASPLLGAAFGILALTLLLQLLQTRFGMSTKNLTPNFQRLNPMRKASNIWKQNAPEAVKAAILLPFFCWVVYELGRQELAGYLELPHMALRHGVETAGDSIRTLLWRAAGFFVVLGLVDFARVYQRYQKDLRMSRQEIRDEMKEVEGHPMIRARMRRLQREMGRKQMMRDVPHASAVIVNPTHFAVAIRYDSSAMAAPKVVARGLDHLALRIRQLAVRSEVPVIENPPLARALYKNTRVGQDIPPHLYRAVAEVLAHLYQMRGGSPR